MTTTSLCLEQLLDSRKTAPLILLSDSVQFGSLPLLSEFARRALHDMAHSVVVILTETNEHVWSQGFQRQHSVLLLDDSHLNSYGKVDFRNYILDFVQRHLPEVRSSTKCTVLIDSLGPLAMISEYQTYQLVKDLAAKTTENIRLIVGHHADVRVPAQRRQTIDVPLNDSLNRLASVVVVLEALKEKPVGNSSLLTGFVPQDSFSYLKTTSNRITRGAIARIEWRRQSGKVQYESNGFYLDTMSNTLVVVPSMQLLGGDKNEKSEPAEEENDQPPKVNATFNLSLTEEQRKTKDNLILPYTKAQQRTPPSGEISIEGYTNSGTIYYEPDAGDDFDDEDPDDDLDI